MRLTANNRMQDIIEEVRQSLQKLIGELQNFQDIAKALTPSSGSLPMLQGIQVYGESMPLNGVIGGDHVIYLDFKNRYNLEARIRQARDVGLEKVEARLKGCRKKVGIALLDVSGHQITDALLAAMLHQAFLLGAIYELDHSGNITERLFENLNTRFYNSSSVTKFLTMIYGEISEGGTFKFISAAHPMPLFFSNRHNQFVDFNEELLTTFPPIGTLPSHDDIDKRATRSVLGYKTKYQVYQINLMGEGDVLLLYTDGLSEHARGDHAYFPDHLEATLRKVKDRSAREIFERIKEGILAFNPPEDDISYIVIKRSQQQEGGLA